ncbi:FAD-dependent oxidoreductase [Arenimonas sp.]|uniref:FAD-dependent oxidoreductase n=1 Tax=Arenimonas sp. TaxID=1872635 RepID=UPI0039E4C64D
MPSASTAVDDVLILGGGVIGLACAHYLLDAGRSVRILERGVVGSATSFGNCGTITPSHAPPLAAPGVIGKALRWMRQPDAPLYIRPRFDPALALWLLRFAARCNARDWRDSAIAKFALLEHSRHEIESLVVQLSLACEFSASGLRYVFRSPDALENALAELPKLHELGIATRTLDSATLAGAEPALLPGMAGAIEFPGDAQFRPDAFTRELAHSLRARGAVIEEGIAVSGFDTAKGRIDAVRTPQGKLRAREVVAAFGPWSPAMLRDLGLRLPIQPGKGYSITYSRPTSAPRMPMVLRERSVCVTAWDSGFRLGSTMEFSGYDNHLNRTRLDALERAAREYLHEPTGSERRAEWYGWRPMTWDDLPLIGKTSAYGNLWLATGHGMMGMSMSAGTGRLLAALMTGAETAIDARPYRPQRFASA